MTPPFDNVDNLAVNTIRTLSMDMVQRANSGHPGLPMGAAPMAYVLWARHLKHNPSDPQWPDRDRFVLSPGHGSALLYSLLHLSGYDVSMDDILAFRQWESKTPGHPESYMTPGVEATTGPLGQGTANAVGMAIAEKHLAQRFNRENFKIVDHYTYALVSDGDLMEGISSEAASIAGHLGLGKLIYLYDSNDISLNGPLSMTFNENLLLRFEACGWHTLIVENGDVDLGALDLAIEDAKSTTDRPSIIEVKTTIGYGSPNKGGTANSHGAPLGDDEVALAKKKLEWPWPDETFKVPDEVRQRFEEIKEKRQSEQVKWVSVFGSWKSEHPDLSEEWQDAMENRLPDGWDKDLPSWGPDDKLATRVAGGKTMNAIGQKIPYLFGGDADLSVSTQVELKDSGSFEGIGGTGKNIRYGVREHAMASVSNGLAWHGGIKPFTSTFFVFSDYMKPAIRLAAMNSLPLIYCFTHDSISVGEDGPTHQPIEHLQALRLIPNLAVMRPCDSNETVEAWKWAMKQTKMPVAIVMTRQKVATLDRTKFAAASELDKGAYVLSEPDGDVKAIIIATGSEVELALEAQKLLASDGIHARVVSMPCWKLFEEQSDEYKNSVLPPGIKLRVSVEAGSTLGWERWVGDEGKIIGIDTFGASAPGNVLVEKFGFTAERVASAVSQLAAHAEI